MIRWVSLRARWWWAVAVAAVLAILAVIYGKRGRDIASVVTALLRQAEAAQKLREAVAADAERAAEQKRSTSEAAQAEVLARAARARAEDAAQASADVRERIDAAKDDEALAAEVNRELGRRAAGPGGP